MRGLCHTCDIYQRVARDDGSGAVEDGLVRVASGVKARFTRLNAEEAQQNTGQGSTRVWRVSTEYVSGIYRNRQYVIRRTEEVT